MKNKKPCIEYNPVGRDGNHWVENIDGSLRFVGLAHDLIRLAHAGWFLSEDGWSGETVAGAVWQLPAKNGKPRYVAGFQDHYNAESALICFGDITDDKTSAAIWADHMAERYAEEAREYDAIFQEEQRAGEEAEQARIADDAQSEIEEEERGA